MDTEAASREIISIRKRLAEVEWIRAALAPAVLLEGSHLSCEEHELHARLAWLQKSFDAHSSARAMEIRPDPHVPHLF